MDVYPYNPFISQCLCGYASLKMSVCMHGLMNGCLCAFVFVCDRDSLKYRCAFREDDCSFSTL